MSMVKYSNTLTIAMATIQTLKHSYSIHQDTLWGWFLISFLIYIMYYYMYYNEFKTTGIEKGLLQNIGDTNNAESLNFIKDKLLNELV